MFSIMQLNIIDGCIEYYPKKTVHKKDNRVIVPFNNLSERILRKYDFDGKKLNISNQKYNDGLVDMVKELREDHPNFISCPTHRTTDVIRL